MTCRTILFALPLSLFCFCKNEAPKSSPVDKPQPAAEGPTIATRFSLPAGFERVPVAANSFAAYLQSLPLRPEGTPVLLFDGSEKWRQDVHAAVVDLDVGKRDLQQCADAVMRLRAEHLFAQKNYADLQFHFTNGFLADYATWRKGHRIKVSGNSVSWRASTEESTSYESFRRYLDLVFAYAGTLSLSKEMRSIDLSELQIGDVFIQGGSPGHAVIVVDLAVQPASGKKVFLLAQSYMPAQDIHVLRNPAGGLWYPLDFGEKLVTPEWTFSAGDLKRF